MVGLNGFSLRQAKRSWSKQWPWLCPVMQCHVLSCLWPYVRKLKLQLLDFGGTLIRRSTRSTGLVGLNYLSWKKLEAWAFMISNVSILPCWVRSVGGFYTIPGPCYLAYFMTYTLKGGTFLSATSKKGASWGWKGILQGHRILESSMHWRVGHACKIRVSDELPAHYGSWSYWPFLEDMEGRCDWKMRPIGFWAFQSTGWVAQTR